MCVCVCVSVCAQKFFSSFIFLLVLLLCFVIDYMCSILVKYHMEEYITIIIKWLYSSVVYAPTLCYLARNLLVEKSQGEEKNSPRIALCQLRDLTSFSASFPLLNNNNKEDF